MSLLAAGRRAAERLMLDRISITRSTGQTFDDATGTYVDNTPTIIYAGRARILTANPQPTEVGERTRPKVNTQVTIPAGTATVIDQRDIVTVVESVNSSFVGSSFNILGESTGTTATSRRFTLQDVQE